MRVVTNCWWNQSAVSLGVFVLCPFLDRSKHAQLPDMEIPVTLLKCDSSQLWSAVLVDTAGCVCYTAAVAPDPALTSKNTLSHTPTLVGVQVYCWHLLPWQLVDRLSASCLFQVYFWARLTAHAIHVMMRKKGYCLNLVLTQRWACFFCFSLSIIIVKACRLSSNTECSVFRLGNFQRLWGKSSSCDPRTLDDKNCILGQKNIQKNP